MKILCFMVLVFGTSCAYLPYIAQETLEIIEEVAEIEEHRNVAIRWWEEDSEEAEKLKELYWSGIIGNSHCIRIRPKKWPFGMC